MAHAGELRRARRRARRRGGRRPPTSRGPGPRLIDGLELLAHILHPERLAGAAGGRAGARAVAALRAERRRRAEARSGFEADSVGGAADDRRFDSLESTSRSSHRSSDAIATQPASARLCARRRSPSSSSQAASAPPIRPADVAAPGDAGQREADDQVDQDQPADAALHDAGCCARAAPPRRRPSARRPRRMRPTVIGAARRAARRASRPAARRRRRREPHAAERRLEHRAEDAQHAHVEADVEQVLVQEAARDDAGTTGRARRPGR